jgi:hypothetical protein
MRATERGPIDDAGAYLLVALWPVSSVIVTLVHASATADTAWWAVVGAVLGVGWLTIFAYGDRYLAAARPREPAAEPPRLRGVVAAIAAIAWPLAGPVALAAFAAYVAGRRPLVFEAGAAVGAVALGVVVLAGLAEIRAVRRVARLFGPPPRPVTWFGVWIGWLVAGGVLWIAGSAALPESAGTGLTTALGLAWLAGSLPASWLIGAAVARR